MYYELVTHKIGRYVKNETFQFMKCTKDGECRRMKAPVVPILINIFIMNTPSDLTSFE